MIKICLFVAELQRFRVGQNATHLLLLLASKTVEGSVRECLIHTGEELILLLLVALKSYKVVFWSFLFVEQCYCSVNQAIGRVKASAPFFQSSFSRVQFL